jgi:hypothetical protein
MRCLAFLPMLLLLSAAFGQSRVEAAATSLVLDESAYWRTYVQFGPDQLDADLLKAEGEKLLGKAGLDRLRRKVVEYCKPPFAPPGERLDLEQVDWRGRASVWFAVGQGDNECAALNCRTPLPPRDWASPAFDDVPWPRQRLPLLVGNVLRPSVMHGDKEMQQLVVRGAWFRTTFEVADPKRAELSVSLTFRGGARLLVNGNEIARGHLPAGELGPETHAGPYPKEAYLCLQDEVPAKLWESEMRKIGVVFCEDLPGRFDDVFADATPKDQRQYWSSRGSSSFAGYFGGWTQINRQGFERVTRLRNRALGPVRVPENILRQGTNVLAVEIRASHLHPVVLSDREANWGRAFQREMFWAHARLLELQVRNAGTGTLSALHRPPGVQVWVEDPHRTGFDGDFGPGGKPGTVRFVGAANGTYSAQVVIGTDRELTGLTVAASDLVGQVSNLPSGSPEPPSPASWKLVPLRPTISYLVGHPGTDLVQLGQIRNTVEDRTDPLCPPAEMAVLRYGPTEARTGRLPRSERLKILQRLRFFDHIGPEPPPRVPAGSCQPIWLTLKVPAEAREGTYRGSVRITADGIDPIVVPVEAEVLGWRLPDPLDFQTVVALEQSPYGVAKHYDVPLWGDEHFRLLEGSFRQLARVGNDLLFVPCLQGTEFGNFDDTPIRWIRRKDGSLGFDYRILDRYLDLAATHLGRRAAICFVVMHGVDRFGPGVKLLATVAVHNEATGSTETLDLGNDSPGYRENWKAFAASLHAHMVEKGLARSMFWGFCWDNFGDPMLPPLLSELVPEVFWARSSHTGQPDATFRLAITSLGRELSAQGLQGWSNPALELLCPRSGSSVLSSNGHSPPFTFRLAVHRSLAAGYRGVGRIGADYWGDVFFRGYKGSLSGGIAGMPCSSVLWPGREGAEPGARFEALREGIQEAEARIYLEQALARNLLDKETAEKARRVLDDHARQTLYISPGRIGVQIHEYAASWQQRSRAILAAAAAAAKTVGLDVDRAKIDETVPARSKVPLALTLRNWTAQPRAWQVSADQPWIQFPQRQGLATGHQRLEFLVDASRGASFQLAAPSEASSQLANPAQPALHAKISLNDVAAGRTYPIEVTARVGKAFDLVMPAFDFLGNPGHAACWTPKPIEDQAVFNVAPGGTDGGEYALVNFSGADLSWKAVASSDWLSVSPADGRLAPGQRVFLNVTARIKPRPSVALTTLAGNVTISDGTLHVTRKVVAHLIPPYSPAAALPSGESVLLADVPKSRVKLHKSRTYWLGTSDPQRNDYGPRFGRNEQVGPVGSRAPAGTMHAAPEQITVYNVDGAGFAAFSAKVLVPASYAKVLPEQLHRVRVNFEVHVDGRLRAQSGLMGPDDAPRLLLAEGLTGAKELKLVTRFDRPEPKNLGKTVYVEWQEAKCWKH